MQKALVVGTLLMVAAGCSGSGSDGGTGGGSGGSNGGSGGSGGSTGGAGGASNTITEAQYCAAIQDAECTYLVRCGGYATKAACTAFLNTHAQSNCIGPQAASVDAGRATYHGDTVATCINALNTVACNGIAALANTSCPGDFVGLVATGSACSYDSDCVSGDFCKLGGNACGGTCKAKIAIGQPVANEEQCVDGAQPFDGTCIAPLAAGKRCTVDDGGFELLPCANGGCNGFALADGGMQSYCGVAADAGQLCNDVNAFTAGCKDFAYCPKSTGLCTPLLGSGAACPRDPFVTPCQGDFFCNGALDSPVCVPLSDTGGPCVTDESCLSGTCSGGLANNPDGGAWKAGSCLAYPAINQACNGICQKGLYCNFTTGTCLTPAADGTQCDSADQCAASSCIARDGGAPSCGYCE